MKTPGQQNRRQSITIGTGGSPSLHTEKTTEPRGANDPNPPGFAKASPNFKDIPQKAEAEQLTPEDKKKAIKKNTLASTQAEKPLDPVVPPAKAEN